MLVVKHKHTDLQVIVNSVRTISECACVITCNHLLVLVPRKQLQRGENQLKRFILFYFCWHWSIPINSMINFFAMKNESN